MGINLYGLSYHVERDKAKELGFDNEVNPGLGLRYRLPRERFDWFLDGGFDELRWKLAAAERITAEVTLPARVPPRDIRARAVGGDYQSFVREGRAAFRTKEPMTIVVRFPKDVVAAPGLGERAHWWLADYKGLLGVLLLLMLTAGVLLRFRTLSARA